MLQLTYDVAFYPDETHQYMQNVLRFPGVLKNISNDFSNFTQRSLYKCIPPAREPKPGTLFSHCCQALKTKSRKLTLQVFVLILCTLTIQEHSVVKDV